MRADLQAILSGCLTFGVPLAFALRELLLLRRRGPWRGDPPAPPEPKPLPPCLLVPPAPALGAPVVRSPVRARELELV